MIHDLSTSRLQLRLVLVRLGVHKHLQPAALPLSSRRPFRFDDLLPPVPRRQRSIDREDERIRARIGSSAEATTRGRVAEDGRDSELDSENARLTTSVATNHADRAEQPPNAFTDMLESPMKELDGNPGARETDDDDDNDGGDDGGDERRRRGASNADASTFRSEIAEAPNETVTVDPNAPLLPHRAASPSESELSMRLSSSSSSSSSGVARDVATATANATRRRDSEKKPTADAAA